MKKYLLFVLFLFLVTSCKYYKVGIEEYFSYWSSNARIISTTYEINYKDASNTQCLPSIRDVKITFKLDNPKDFKLYLNNDKYEVIAFSDGITGIKDGKVQKDIDYTMVQTDRYTLILTLKKAFLEKYEYGAKKLNPIIALFEDPSGKPFPEKHRINFKVNTAPPEIQSITAQSKEISPEKPKYCFCLNIPDMVKTVASTTELLHKDIEKIRVKINGSTEDYPIALDAGGFTPPLGAGHFIARTNVQVLSDALPSGNWVLYYKTDIEVSEDSPYKEYEFQLIDKAGCVSKVLKTNTPKQKPSDITITRTDGTETSVSLSTDETQPTKLTANETDGCVNLKLFCLTPNTSIEYTLIDLLDNSESTGNANPVALKLKPQTFGKDKKYKIKVQAKGVNYSDGDEKTYFVLITRGDSSGFNPDLPKPEDYKLEIEPATRIVLDSTVTMKLSQKNGSGGFTAQSWDSTRMKESKIAIYQGGSPIGTEVTSNDGFAQLKIPLWLPSASYTLVYSINIDGITISGELDFKVE